MIMKKFTVMQGAVIRGEVNIERGSSVWYNAVIRGDIAPVFIGRNTNIQECAVLHVDAGLPLVLGDGVTVGHGAILHSCEVGDNSLIGMGAIVLNGAKIGKNCIVGAGALVTGNSVFPDNSLILGAPAKIKREVTDDEIAANTANAEEYVRLSEAVKE